MPWLDSPWNPHAPCKYVYTMYRELCTSIEVSVYIDDMPDLTDLEFLSLYARVSI